MNLLSAAVLTDVFCPMALAALSQPITTKSDTKPHSRAPESLRLRISVTPLYALHAIALLLIVALVVWQWTLAGVNLRILD